MESNKTSWITTIIFILILILVIVTITLYITKKDETCDMFKNLIVDKLCPIKDPITNPTTESKTNPTTESKTNPTAEPTAESKTNPISPAFAGKGPDDKIVKEFFSWK